MRSTIYEFADQAQPGARTKGAPRQGRSDSRRLTARRARIGVIYNPRSHRNKGQDLALGERHHVMVATPETRAQIAAALDEFARSGIDYLIVNGGDGTVRDVLTLGHGVFGDDWPALAVLPKGKTNALNVDLGAPDDWSLRAAIDAFTQGRQVVRRPLQVRRRDAEGVVLHGFILGAGAFTLGIRAGQEAHSLGFFNSLAVGVTAAWGLGQTLFGFARNPWRRGVTTDIRLQPGDRALPHSGAGEADRRTLLLATTLCRLPMGIKPFGHVREGLKLLAWDRPRRRMVPAVPAILAGWESDWLQRMGLHRADAEGFTMTLGDEFILDGEAFPAGAYDVRQGPELRFVIA